MKVLTPRVDLAGFFERVATAPGRVLMLDYDGTLAPFNVRPERAVPYPEVLPVLDAIVSTGAVRVVVVSGRPAGEVPPLLALTERPEIWGSHGWERLMPDGRRIVQQPTPAASEALRAAAAAVEAVQADGARIEVKLACVALHWRGLAAEHAAAVEMRARSAWMEAVDGGALEFLPFDGGLELRATGCNKQYAVKAVLSETPDDHAVAYLGDDVTDEDAFRAVKLQGLGVLVRTQFRETAADVWLKPPHELVEFLSHWRPTRT
jgi:trehalose 6-phosphate phosphatase